MILGLFNWGHPIEYFLDNNMINIIIIFNQVSAIYLCGAYNLKSSTEILHATDKSKDIKLRFI